jgi:urea carboxylase
VGIGGAYMCIYGMEGPGGYQLFGRTIQVWNTHGEAPPFEPGHPWLLRHFDQIRFFEVSNEELEEARAGFLHGKYPLRIEAQKFSLGEYKAFLTANADSIAAFQTTQRAAFAAEREDWAAKGLNKFEEIEAAPPPEEAPLAAGERGIASPVPGSIWQVLLQPGARVAAGDVVMIIESMKMEVQVRSPASGILQSISGAKGQIVRAGQRLGIITP